MKATTVRLPPELDERLVAHCEDVGAVKNRVVAIALRDYLDDLPPREQAVVDALRDELDAREVEAA